MKTINKLFKGIFFCTLVSVSVSSCDLEVEPPANIAAETYWTSEKDAWYNLNSIYSAAIPGIGIYGDAYSDDVYCQYAHESNAKYSSKMVSALFMMKVGTLRQFVRKTCFCRKLEIVRWMNL